jgi:hypothetical protein
MYSLNLSSLTVEKVILNEYSSSRDEDDSIPNNESEVVPRPPQEVAMAYALLISHVLLHAAQTPPAIKMLLDKPRTRKG